MGGRRFLARARNRGKVQVSGSGIKVPRACRRPTGATPKLPVPVTTAVAAARADGSRGAGVLAAAGMLVLGGYVGWAARLLASGRGGRP